MHRKFAKLAAAAAASGLVLLRSSPSRKALKASSLGPTLVSTLRMKGNGDARCNNGWRIQLHQVHRVAIVDTTAH